MTSKEKAKQLVEKMSMEEEFNGSLELMELYPVPKNKYAKECALIAVDEIIKNVGNYGQGAVYWYHVKQEIEKL
jgi:hypothetical protein